MERVGAARDLVLGYVRALNTINEAMRVSIPSLEQLADVLGLSRARTCEPSTAQSSRSSRSVWRSRSAGQRAGVARRRPPSSPAADGRPLLRSTPSSPQGHHAMRHRCAAQTAHQRGPLGRERAPFRDDGGAVRAQVATAGPPAPTGRQNKISSHLGCPAARDRRARDLRLNSF